MRIPDELKRNQQPLAKAMLQVQKDSSLPQEKVEQVIGRLPASLANTEAFHCSVDGLLRYEFGASYDVGTPVVGTDQNPEVRILLCGLLRLIRFASSADFDAYTLRLEDKPKHLDTLAELDPVLRAKELAHLKYEPRPLGPGSAGPDWAMHFLDGTCCFVEVKSRIKELLKLFFALLADSEPSSHASRMPVLPGLLKGVSRKFPALDSTSNTLQGVWVYSPVAFIQEQLRALFDGLDAEKVRFLVVGHGWREYEALTRDAAVRNRLVQRYSLPGV